jgi:hypothetical protein
MTGFSTVRRPLMGTSRAIQHARRARSQNSAEDKLDAIAQAIEELADAVDDIERRLKHTEAYAAAAANRR